MKQKNSGVKNLPFKKWKSGNVEVVIWNNKKQRENEEMEFKTVSISRSYKKKDEEIWRNDAIHNLRRQDLVKLSLMLHEAQKELYFTEGESSE